MAYTAFEIQLANALMNNQGLAPLPAALTTAIASYNSTTVMANWLAAVAWYKTRSFYTESTFQSLLSIGEGTCPALGNSVPVAPLGTYTSLETLYLTINPDDDLDPSGVSNFVEDLGNAYLGSSDCAAFAQGFMAVNSFVTQTNQLINSTLQANEYLGPTFTNLDNLYTAGVSQVTTDIGNVAVDLKNTGSLLQFDQLEHLGEPATLLQSLANSARGGILPDVYEQLLLQGLLPQEITDLVTNNRQSLFNQSGLEANEFDQLQKRAYPALANVTAENGLLDALAILDVTTANITALSDLLDPVKIFPTSWQSLLTPTTDGPVNIYQDDGALSPGLEQAVNNFAATPLGCDELGKIIPPESAVANKAVAASLAQINNIVNITPQQLWPAMREFADRDWDVNQYYLANDLVAYDSNNNYRALQDVLPGVDITDTDYWQPSPVDGVSLPTAGLDLVAAQTTPVDNATVTDIETNLATGTGPNGTITLCDVIGTATDHNNLAVQFDLATATVNALQTAGALTALNTTYTNIVTRANDAQVISDIASANSNISSVVSGYPAQTASLNTVWGYIANSVNQELAYQNQIPFNYFDVTAGRGDIMAFSQNLTTYSQDCTDCGSQDFLNQIADTTTVGGQSLVAGLRTRANQDVLGESGVGILPFAIPENPPITPPCAVVPQ